MIVCDYANHCMQIFSQEGEVVRTLSLPFQAHGKSFGPHSAAVCADCSIVVVNVANACVHVFDSNGTYVKDIGPLNISVDRPCSMAVGKDRLYVNCYQDPAPLQVVDLTSKSATVCVPSVAKTRICLTSKGRLITYQ